MLLCTLTALIEMVIHIIFRRLMFTILDLLQKIFSSGGMLYSHSVGYPCVVTDSCKILLLTLVDDFLPFFEVVVVIVLQAPVVL